MEIMVTGKMPHQDGLIGPLYFDPSERKEITIAFTPIMRIRSGHGRFYCQDGNAEVLITSEQLKNGDIKAINSQLVRTFTNVLQVRVITSRNEVRLWQLVYDGMYIKYGSEPSLVGVFTVERQGDVLTVTAPDDTSIKAFLSLGTAQVIGARIHTPELTGTCIRVQRGNLYMTYYKKGMIQDEIKLLKSYE